MDVIDLVAFAKPLPKVRFPNGSEHQLVPFDALTWRRFRELQAETDPAKRDVASSEVLRRCAPTASEEDITSLGTADEDVQRIVLTCMRQLDLALQLLGNSGAGIPQRGSDSEASSPTTMSSTSSAESGELPAAVPSSA